MDTEIKIEELAKKALTEGTPDAALIFRAFRIRRSGSMFEEFADYEVVGEAESLKIDETHDQFGVHEDFVVIPRQKYVVVVQKYYHETDSETRTELSVAAFDGSGWKYMRL